MPNGIIPVYKEQGYTSFDVVAKLRGILGIRKIGHTGTLDPMATGVLPVCVGKATKLVDYLTGHNKVYEAVMKFGVETDSYDITGDVIKEMSFSSSFQEVKEAAFSFIGEYEQVPPMFSAIKIDGKRLYDLAREGLVVERKPRKCFIFDMEVLEGCELPYFAVRVACSKGTYIRSLAHDIGEKLNNCACLTELKRTVAGNFELKDCYKLSEIEAMVNELGGKEALVHSGHNLPFLVGIEEIFYDDPDLVLSVLGEKIVLNGGKIKEDGLKEISLRGEFEVPYKKKFIKMYSADNRFLALYRYHEIKKIWELVLLG